MATAGSLEDCLTVRFYVTNATILRLEKGADDIGVARKGGHRKRVSLGNSCR